MPCAARRIIFDRITEKYDNVYFDALLASSFFSSDDRSIMKGLLRGTISSLVEDCATKI
jgi:hypothetical protein